MSGLTFTHWHLPVQRSDIQIQTRDLRRTDFSVTLPQDSIPRPQKSSGPAPARDIHVLSRSHPQKSNLYRFFFCASKKFTSNGFATSPKLHNIPAYTLPIKYLLFMLSINIHKPLLFLTEKQAWAAAASMVRHGKMRAALPLWSSADISVHCDLIKLCYNTMNIYSMNLSQCLHFMY